MTIDPAKLNEACRDFAPRLRMYAASYRLRAIDSALPLDVAVFLEDLSREAVPALLAEVERLEKERDDLIDRHERAEGELIDERDAMGEALAQAFYLITGRSPEWSNKWGIPDAIEEIDDAQTLLRKAVTERDAQLASLQARGDALAEALTNAAIPLEALNLAGLERFDPTSRAEIENGIKCARAALAASEQGDGG